MMQRLVISVTLAALCAGCAGSGVEALLPDSARLPKHSVNHQLDGRQWRVGHQAANEQELLSEQVLKGESVKNWTELLTLLIVYEPDVDIQRLVKAMQGQLAAGSKDFRTAVIHSRRDDVMFEWSHKGSGRWPAQREIKRVMRGTDGIYVLSYSVKELSYSPKMYETWRKNIAGAKLGLRKRR